jgi:hypothetical protein
MDAAQDRLASANSSGVSEKIPIMVDIGPFASYGREVALGQLADDCRKLDSKLASTPGR